MGSGSIWQFRVPLLGDREPVSPYDVMMQTIAIVGYRYVFDDVPDLARGAANHMVALAEAAINERSNRLHRIVFLIDAIAMLEAMRYEQWQSWAKGLTWGEIDAI